MMRMRMRMKTLAPAVRRLVSLHRATVASLSSLATSSNHSTSRSDNSAAAAFTERVHVGSSGCFLNMQMPPGSRSYVNELLQYWLSNGAHRVLFDQYALVLPSNLYAFAPVLQTYRFPDGKSNLDLKSWFKNDRPIHVDIGSGYGQWVINRATSHPEINFIALEIDHRRLANALVRHVFSGLKQRVLTSKPDNVDQSVAVVPNHSLPPPSNLKFVCAPAALFFERLLPDASLHEVYVSYPCPHFKKKHAKRRLINPEFVPVLASKMASGAKLRIVSDHLELVQFMTSSLVVEKRFQSVVPFPHYVSQFPADYESTRFHALFETRGRSAMYMEWERL